jgi:mutator protein MutT
MKMKTEVGLRRASLARAAVVDTIEVAAGLIFRAGRLLITQRRLGDHLGGLWEFPGGKRHAEETFEDCLRRELREELGVQVEVLSLVDEVYHVYPEKRVRLRFYWCRLTEGEPRAIGCAAVAWVTTAELTGYPFPAADARLLSRLRESPQFWV